MDLLHTIWPLGLVLIALPVAIDVYFLSYRRLFALLEREDWPALADYLEKKICQEGRYSSRYVQFFVQSCLAMGNFNRVVEFSQKVLAVKPALVEANALIFGAAHILGGNAVSSAKFYRERLEKAGSAGEKTEWISWYYGFSLATIGETEQAGSVFGILAASARGIPVAGLSAFFLSEKLKIDPQLNTNADDGRDRVRKALKSINGWNRKTAKLKTKVHGAIIKTYLDEAGLWLFGEGST
jgi:tetratricopeptide (TPR) repeat protein